MSNALIVRGHYRDHVFTPDGPLPDAEGTAELIINTTSAASQRGSIADAFGKAPVLKSAEEIEKQIREEHESWGER